MLAAQFLIPFLVLILWLAVIGYLFVLATRFVQAVEQIARSMAQRASSSPEP